MRAFLSGFEGLVKIIDDERAQLYHRLKICDIRSVIDVRAAPSFELPLTVREQTTRAFVT
jgi:hypothetical protein